MSFVEEMEKMIKEDEDLALEREVEAFREYLKVLYKQIKEEGAHAGRILSTVDERIEALSKMTIDDYRAQARGIRRVEF